MGKKYFYEEGMCRALGYKGQYPVIYESNCEKCKTVIIPYGEDSEK